MFYLLYVPAHRAIACVFCILPDGLLACSVQSTWIIGGSVTVVIIDNAKLQFRGLQIILASHHSRSFTPEIKLSGKNMKPPDSVLI